MIKAVFLAKFREKLGVSELQLEPLKYPLTVEEVKILLAAKGDTWRDLFECERVLIAVNQEMVSPDALVNKGDEIAFFPPVTGG